MSDNRAEPPEPTWGNPTDEHTVGRERTPRFRSTRPRSRWVGVLTPVGGLETQAIRLDRDEMVVGREKGLTAPVADASVSRQHARITRRSHEFELEDLGSFNGTHINGVPVRSCVLADGDTVQFCGGSSLQVHCWMLPPGSRLPADTSRQSPLITLTIRYVLPAAKASAPPDSGSLPK